VGVGRPQERLAGSDLIELRQRAGQELADPGLDAEQHL
jgi:hypothetical protein